MQEKFAKQLDSILEQANNTGNSQVILFPSEDLDIQQLDALGDFLEKKGYAEHLGGNLFNVTPNGFAFIREDSFYNQYKKGKEEEEAARLQYQLTSSQVKAAKREPWLIAWSIITTIATIILSILQLIK